MEMSPHLGDRTDTRADRSGATTGGAGTLGSVPIVRRFRPAQRRLEVPHSGPQGCLGIGARGLGRDGDLEQRAAETGCVAGVMDTRDAGAAGDLARGREGVRVVDGQPGPAGSSGTFCARARAGSPAGMPSSTDARAFSAFLISSPVSYTHLRAHETRHDLVCRL